ncbi:hypothetical protein [Mesorhizobium sp. Pch-S]|uniref:hypothetical protein n=1 Tax=Mesorhizobium sp. Pch-S TaxID=2082387 RepID=UPI0013EA8EB2|nr:hypothetical protein [Mesorhizobium sp. Pch-S]
MAEIEIVSIDIDSLDLDEETKALFISCLPKEPVDWSKILTEERIAEAMIAADLVRVQ